MRLHLNYAALRQLPHDQARKELFHGINAALKVLPMALDVLGENRALQMTANVTQQTRGKASPLTMEEAKAYLTSERAAPYFGGQKWTVAADHASLINLSSRIVSFSNDALRDIDLGYTALYNLVDMRGTGQDSFDLVSAYMGFTWEQRKPGEQIKPRRNITADSVPVTFITAGDGFSLLDDWITYGKFYKVDEALAEFTNSYFVTKASRHYAPIIAVGAGQNTAFTVDDTTTFNAAVAAMLRALQAKGYMLGSNVQVDIMVNPEKVGRILAMLDAKRGSPMIAYGTQNEPIAYSVRNVISTMEIPGASTGYYIVLPERKLKRGEWMDLRVETQRDASTSANDWYGRGQYNAIVGDQDQVRRVLYA